MKHEKSAPAGYRPRFAGTMKLYLVRHKEYGEYSVSGIMREVRAAYKEAEE